MGRGRVRELLKLSLHLDFNFDDFAPFLSIITLKIQFLLSRQRFKVVCSTPFFRLTV